MEARQSARATVRLCCVVSLLVGDRSCDSESEVERVHAAGAHSTSQTEEALNKIIESAQRTTMRALLGEL